MTVAFTLKITLVAGLIALYTPRTAHAQATRMMMPEGSQDIDFGVVTAYAPVTEGNKRMRFLLLPFATVHWSNGVFLQPGEFGLSLPAQANLQYGPVFAYGVKPERADSVNNTRLNGEVGGFLNYQLAHNIGLKSRLMYGGGDNRRGTRLELSAALSAPLSSHQSAGIAIGLIVADHTYMQSYFGINADQALRGHRTLYDAGSGIEKAFITLNWGIELTTKYQLSVLLGVNQLSHGAAASQLFVHRTGTFALASLTYHY